MGNFISRLGLSEREPAGLPSITHFHIVFDL
jgi:hypothetical protein